MNRLKSLLCSSVVLASLAPSAFADVSAQKAADADKLMKAYQYVTGYDIPMPFAAPFSECEYTECAFNYETDREDFGFNVLYVDLLSEDESSLISFQTDPNGTTLGRASWTVESPFGETTLPRKSVKAIGKRIKRGFGPLIGTFGPLLVNESECRYSSDSVWCAFNYQTDYENLGIYVKGLLNSDKTRIDFIEVLSVDPNGVMF